MLRLPYVSLVLLTCAACAYLGILSGGREARARVVDASAYGAVLASDGLGATNTSFDPSSGSAGIGVRYDLPSSAVWTISPVARNVRARRWLYVMADRPEFFAAAGSLVIAVGSRTVGTLHARSTGAGSTFVSDTDQYAIRMPPSQTFGYRFPLDDPGLCSATPCNVSIHGRSAFWHVDRFAVIGERARYLAPAER